MSDYKKCGRIEMWEQLKKWIADEGRETVDKDNYFVLRTCDIERKIEHLEQEILG